MKKIILISAVLVAVSGCSFLTDLEKHCKITGINGNIKTIGFKGCIECDSLAQVVSSTIQKANVKIASSKK